jgi:SRSO17 transposase
MASCHKLTLEDSRGRVPLPRFGGHGRERPADGTAAETFDSLEETLHDPRRWGLSSEAIGTLGERLYACWRRLRNGFKTCTRDTSGRAYDSLRGQLTMDGARNFANMARNMTGDDGQALQHCMANAPWSGPGVCQQRQAESTATPALAHGSTLIVDESADEKAGTHHVGASRQYNGRMGQVEVCRVDTCLTYAKTTVGLWVMVDGALCLPQEWFGPDFAQRRKELGMPEERTFETKIALGLKMVQRATVPGLPFELLACDALYGRDSPFRADVDTAGVWYAAQVPADTPVYVSEPQVGVPQQRSTRGRPRPRLQVLSPHPPQEVRLLAGSPSTLWQHRHVRQTERGRLAADCAIRQVWTVAEGKMPRADWLVLRRDAEGDCASTLLNAPADTPAPHLMAWSCQRYCTERTFEDAKTEIGWDAFQAQKYRAWEHHVALTGLALWFVAQTKLAWAQAYARDPDLARQLEGEVLPALSTANVRELLKAVLPVPQLTPQQATELVITHLVKRARSTSSRLRCQVKPHDSS